MLIPDSLNIARTDGPLLSESKNDGFLAHDSATKKVHLSRSGFSSVPGLKLTNCSGRNLTDRCWSGTLSICVLTQTVNDRKKFYP